MSDGEVSECVEIPLAAVLDKSRYAIRESQYNGQTGHYHQFHYAEAGRDIDVYGISGGIMNYFRHFTNKERGPLDYRNEHP